MDTRLIAMNGVVCHYIPGKENFVFCEIVKDISNRLAKIGVDPLCYN
jgi:hypothetical protein